jgi:hypothetical protein
MLTSPGKNGFINVGESPGVIGIILLSLVKMRSVLVDKLDVPMSEAIRWFRVVWMSSVTM